MISLMHCWHLTAGLNRNLRNDFTFFWKSYAVTGHCSISPAFFKKISTTNQMPSHSQEILSFIQAKQNQISWDKFLQIPANFEIISQQI
jgi:hypothetical protein